MVSVLVQNAFIYYLNNKEIDRYAIASMKGIEEEIKMSFACLKISFRNKIYRTQNV